tara:strand:+ start:267 stop:407 length:141 start_codon:yes stop_codon:yes gene_type:complete
MHIKKIHKKEGESLEKPSETLAKLLEAIPHDIAITKKRYPNKGFMK